MAEEACLKFLSFTQTTIIMIVSNKLTQMQLELLKSFKHITDEKQLQEVKSLLNFYFRRKLDAAIGKEETSRNYTAAIYEEWLSKSSKWQPAEWTSY